MTRFGHVIIPGIALLSLYLGLGSCTLNSILPWDGPRLEEPRDQLTLAQLQSDELLPLMDMSFFARPAWAGEAEEDFSGTLIFHDSSMSYPIERAYYEGENIFPALRLQFISHEGALIPVDQSLQRTWQDSASLWDVMVGIGEIWQEDTDEGWMRASFPLSLTDRFIGQVRNCVASFAYRDGEVSNVCLQCSQETADAEDGRLGDMRAMLEAEFVPSIHPDAEILIQEHLDSMAERLPVLPLSTLDTGNRLARYFDKRLRTNASTSLGALLIGETLYLHPPATHHGLYPYPGEMRHGVYSVSKSMAGALSLFYFAERYGEQIFDALVTDYVSALSDHPAWQGVNFSHALNMVTGTEGGEDAARLQSTIIRAESADEAISAIARLGNTVHRPGTAFNYASTNLFVLSFALQEYVRRIEGDGVNYWDLVREKVLIPIGAGHYNVQHTMEEDGSPGIPYLAYGATPTLQDAASIAALLNNDGVYEGRQLLSRRRVQEALGRSQWQGYSTSGDWRGDIYRHGFWSAEIRGASGPVRVTYMLGFGANHVIFLPDGTVIFRFMDEFDFDIETLVRRVQRIIP